MRGIPSSTSKCAPQPWQRSPSSSSRWPWQTGQRMTSSAWITLSVSPHQPLTPLGYAGRDECGCRTDALPISAIGIDWALLRSPLAHRLIAHPTGERWSEHATPTFGGVGIFAGLAAGIVAAVAVGGFDGRKELLGVLAGAALLFLVGLIDDVYALPAAVKLGAQFARAAIALVMGLSVEIVTNDVLAATLGVLWLVGMTNAFNLLDNMDGLAGSLAVIAATLLRDRRRHRP